MTKHIFKSLFLIPLFLLTVGAVNAQDGRRITLEARTQTVVEGEVEYGRFQTYFIHVPEDERFVLELESDDDDAEFVVFDAGIDIDVEDCFDNGEGIRIWSGRSPREHGYVAVAVTNRRTRRTVGFSLNVRLDDRREYSSPSPARARNRTEATVNLPEIRIDGTLPNLQIRVDDRKN